MTFSFLLFIITVPRSLPLSKPVFHFPIRNISHIWIKWKHLGLPYFCSKNSFPWSKHEGTVHSGKNKGGSQKDGRGFFRPSRSSHEVMPSNDSRNSLLAVGHAKGPRALQHKSSDAMVPGFGICSHTATKLGLLLKMQSLAVKQDSKAGRHWKEERVQLMGGVSLGVTAILGKLSHTQWAPGRPEAACLLEADHTFFFFFK